MNQYVDAEIDKRFHERVAAESGSSPSKSIIALAMDKELSSPESAGGYRKRTSKKS
jgi:hypothetical protein